MNKQSNISKVVILFIGLIIVNFITDVFYQRIDLTQDKRYTLSEPAVDILSKVEEPILVKVYLQGDFPTEFKRLQIETRQLLEELKSENKNIKFRFIDPLDDNPQKLIASGLEPSQLSVQENGKVSEIVIFPWATVEKENRIENVSLLSETNAQSQDEQLENAIQNLEYGFVNAIHKLTSEKKQKIAVLKGNGELDDIFIADFLRKIGEYYRLAPFTLDSVSKNPENTLKKLNEYDLTIIAKPTEKFTEEEKYTLDQYIMNNRKTLWLVDNVHAELDSLMQTGESLAFPRDLNLTDMLFSYGVRINPNLVQDLYSAKIPLAKGKVGNKTQFNQFMWNYYPTVLSKNNHPINKHIEPVSLKFANSIDILKNDIEKNVILSSSPLSKTQGAPSIISLSSIRKAPKKEEFNKKNIPIGVLLEGDFTSAYANRVKPFKIRENINKSKSNKMIVIADGDIIANQVTNGIPERLGFDKYTGQQYGNKEFLLNCVNYLLDDNGLLDIRSKNIDLKMLDREKAYTSRTTYQIINILIPLVLLAIFGIVFNIIRKKKYA